MYKKSEIPETLAAIAADREHIKTDALAHAMNKAPQTVQKNYCLTGKCYGIRPIKVGNTLLWPVVSTAALLNGGG